MSNWMTVKVKYTKQLQDGTFKLVSEPYLVSAMTFTDAEARIYEELGSFIRGEFVVNGITRTDFHDIFHYEDADVWYKCKITYEAGCDGGEEGAKTKKVSQSFLVTANSVKEASERIKESLSGMMIDYIIKSVVESPIIDVFAFNDSEPKDNLSIAVDTVQQIANILDGREYGNELQEHEIENFEKSGIVVVYGASDDLTEFSGAISDEQGIGNIYFNKDGEFFDEDELSAKEKASLNRITTYQTPFRCETTIPHSTFRVMEDGEEYGIGIVFSVHNLY